MKVLYVVTAYPRWDGDVITPWLTETIRRLRGVGVTVEVLAPAYRGLGDQEIEGVRVHRFRYAPSAWETLTHDQTAPDRVRERPWYLPLVPLYVVAGCLRARRLVRTEEFDVVHTFWPIPHGVIGIAAKGAAGVPMVSTFFGVELTWLKSQLPFLAPVLRWIVRSSDAVTVISSYTAGRLRELVPGVAVEIIPFGAGIDTVSFPSRANGRGVGSAFELLFVGRLVERKGVQYLLRAVSLLRSRGRDVVLTLVGQGPYGDSLKTTAAELGLRGDAVRFEGQLPDEEVAARFAECDVFVLPAATDAKGDVEGLGVVLIEAMRAQRPVIASETGGIPDVVRDGETGILVPPGDIERLAAAVERYMDDPQLAARVAAAGRADVELRFSWEAIIDRLVNLYASVAGARHG